MRYAECASFLSAHHLELVGVDAIGKEKWENIGQTNEMYQHLTHSNKNNKKKENEKSSF